MSVSSDTSTPLNEPTYDRNDELIPYYPADLRAFLLEPSDCKDLPKMIAKKFNMPNPDDDSY
jgi:hypothetical protein